MVISSRNNEKVKRIASLKEKKFRKAENAFLVEGFKMVKEAFSYGMQILSIIGTESGLNKLLADLNKKISEIPCEVICVSESVFERVSDSVTPQGVAAVIAVKKKETEGKKSVLLDGVSDPGNMGTIIRTLAAVGIDELYLVNCCDPYSPKAVRASMSGIYFVNIEETTYSEVFAKLNGAKLLVADMGGKNVFEYAPPERYCLVIGSEANGVSEEIRAMADDALGIPMEAHSESLNAAVSLSVILYELTYGKIMNK